MTQHLSELELHHLEMEQDWFALDPVPQFDEARAKHPWLASSNLGHVVTSYPVIRELFAQEDRMRTSFDEMVEAMGATGTPWGDFQHRHILNQSGAEHRRLRDLLAPAFTPRQANRHREIMRETIAELLDLWAPKGRFDFEEFASWFPITVQCRMIGASPDAIPELRDSLEALGLSASMDKRVLGAMQEGTVKLTAFSEALIEEREAVRQPGDDNDLLDVLIEAKGEGGLTRQELVDILIFLFVAGYDTSKNILTLTMYEMLAHPDIYARCAEDPSYAAKVIDETMRFHGSTNTMRLVTQDFVHRDVLIPAGTTLWFPWAIAGRDPATAEDAHLFRPERQNKQAHVGFALGGHMCLGQFIARAQLAEGLHLIAQRIVRPTSPGPDGWRVFPGVWGIRGLPIEFEAA
jgi:cytochrome P450